MKFLTESLFDVSNPNISFGIITNGTLIDDKTVDLFIKYNFTVTVSIDGPKEVNDKLRVYNNGSGTYNDIAKGIKKIIANKISAKYEIFYTNIHEKNNLNLQRTESFLQKEFGFNSGFYAKTVLEIYIKKQVQ